MANNKAFDDKVRGILNGTEEFTPDPAIWGDSSDEDTASEPQNDNELERLAENTAWNNLGRDGEDMDPSDYAGVDHWTRKEVESRAAETESRIRTTYSAARAHADHIGARSESERDHAIVTHLRGGGSGRNLTR